jgi:hypothetical protein
MPLDERTVYKVTWFQSQIKEQVVFILVKTAREMDETLLVFGALFY